MRYWIILLHLTWQDGPKSPGSLPSSPARSVNSRTNSPAGRPRRGRSWGCWSRSQVKKTSNFRCIQTHKKHQKTATHQVDDMYKPNWLAVFRPGQAPWDLSQIAFVRPVETSWIDHARHEIDSVRWHCGRYAVKVLQSFRPKLLPFEDNIVVNNMLSWIHFDFFRLLHFQRGSKWSTSPNSQASLHQARSPSPASQARVHWFCMPWIRRTQMDRNVRHVRNAYVSWVLHVFFFCRNETMDK